MEEYLSDLDKLKRAIKKSNSPERQIFYQSMIENREGWISTKKEKGMSIKRESKEDRIMREALATERVQRIYEGLHLWL